MRSGGKLSRVWWLIVRVVDGVLRPEGVAVVGGAIAGPVVRRHPGVVSVGGKGSIQAQRMQGRALP